MTSNLFPRKSLAALALLSLARLSAHAQVEITDPPEGHNFGKVPLNATYATQYFSVFNRGNAAVQLGTVASSGAAVVTCAGLGCPVVAQEDFKIPQGSDGCSNATLQPSQGCSTLVSFSPSAPGSRISQLVVRSRDGASLATYMMHGTGTSQPLDCVLDWAEKTFPQILTMPTGTATVSPFHARCYANGTLCLGADTAVPTFDQPSVYLYQTQPTPSVQRLGYLSTFAEAAQCRP